MKGGQQKKQKGTNEGGTRGVGSRKGWATRRRRAVEAAAAASAQAAHERAERIRDYSDSFTVLLMPNTYYWRLFGIAPKSAIIARRIPPDMDPRECGVKRGDLVITRYTNRSSAGVHIRQVVTLTDSGARLSPSSEIKYANERIEAVVIAHANLLPVWAETARHEAGAPALELKQAITPFEYGG
jgi:hypothetical protein